MPCPEVVAVFYIRPAEVPTLFSVEGDAQVEQQDTAVGSLTTYACPWRRENQSVPYRECEVLTVMQSLLSHGPNLPVRALVCNALSAALPTVGICRNVQLSEHQTVGMSHHRTVNVRNVPLSATLDIDTLRCRLCVSLLSFPCQVLCSAGKKAPAQGIIKLFLERKEFWYFKPVKGLGRQTAGRKRGMATCRPICSHKDSALCLRSFLVRLSMPSHCRFESLSMQTPLQEGKVCVF